MTPEHAEPIAWDLAARVAGKVAKSEPFSASYLADSLQRDFAEFGPLAERLVAQETGLISQQGPVRIHVVDRPTWAAANVRSLRRLLRPLTQRIAERNDADSKLSKAGRQATGAQLGAVLGWMSGRVLGQYDSLVLEDEQLEDQDIVYIVGPNVLALEKRYAFPPREFRLWIALHECAHRAQFTGVPWMMGHFRQLITDLLLSTDTDPQRLQASVADVVRRVKAGENPFSDGGLIAAFAGEEQRARMQSILGLMALLEGHGEVTMTRAGGDRIPSAERFHRVMHDRRQHSKGFAKIMQRLLGMDAKLRQYAEGEKFLLELERVGGRELTQRVWEAPGALPTLVEIRAPQQWIDRMNAAEADD